MSTNNFKDNYDFSIKVEDSDINFDFLSPWLRDLLLSLANKPNDVSSSKFGLFIMSLLKRIALISSISNVSHPYNMVVTKWS